jgi:hypothetical protein
MSGPPPVSTLMFDFYGTVVDMQGGLVGTITPFLEAKGYEGPRTAWSRGGGARTSRTR